MYLVATNGLGSGMFLIMNVDMTRVDALDARLQLGALSVFCM